MDSLVEFLFRSLGWTKEQQQLIVRTAWVALVTFHILWACGWLTFLGVNPPFASAADMKSVNDTAKTISDTTNKAIAGIADQILADRLERIEHDILQTKTSFCQAKNEEAKSLYARRVQELSDRYYSISHNNPRVPTCDEV